MLFRTFANNTAGKYSLSNEEHFHRLDNGNMSHLRREARRGQHKGKSKQMLCFGRFPTMDAGRSAEIVPWRSAMDEGVRTELA